MPSLNRELMLVKVNAKGAQRGRSSRWRTCSRRRSWTSATTRMSVELTGSPEKIDDFVALLAALRDRGDGAKRRRGNGTKQEDPVRGKAGGKRGQEMEGWIGTDIRHDAEGRRAVARAPP